MLEAGANTFLKKPIDHIAPQKAIMDRILEKALVG